MRRFFPTVKKIRYEGPDSKNPLAFKHYNPREKVGGKTLEEHLRFSVAYWHSFRGTGGDPFGPGTIQRPWEQGRDPLAVAKVRLEAGFEFFQKIRSPFWCFHDRDIAPEGATLADVKKTMCFLTNMADFPVFNEAYVEGFGDHRPARSTIGVAALPVGGIVEIEAWAFVG